VLLRLAYLGVTNAFALLRLLPISDSTKDAEILALRHQLTVLERQLHGEKIRFTPGDPALLAALLHTAPRNVLSSIRPLVRPETVLRWQCAARRLVVSPMKLGGTWRNVSGSDGLPGSER
jgi:putative transposase